MVVRSQSQPVFEGEKWKALVQFHLNVCFIRQMVF
jgi:hypothetical protein